MKLLKLTYRLAETSKLLLTILLAFLAAGAIVLAQRNPIVPGRWAVTRGNMQTARSNACSVLLSDGRVLITGGVSGGQTLSSAEFYETDGSFTPAPSMAAARSDHACGLLPDGTMFVGGGHIGGAMTNASEIFEPDANRWKPGPSMPSSRAGASFAVLNDGRLLLAGGEVSGAISNDLVLFDPASGSYPPVAARMSAPRRDHAMAVLKDGRVLIGGGFDGEHYLDSLDLFDPATGMISSAGRLSVGRSGLSATTLLDGRVVFLGGADARTEYGGAEIYNPRTGAIGLVKAMMAQPRRGHAAIRIPNNNTVLIIGGSAAGQPVSQNEAYIPWTRAFQSAGSLDAGRTAATVLPLAKEGTALVAGGDSAAGAVAIANTACQPTVRTDKADYSPGTTVIITGTCWLPGGTVRITLIEQPDNYGESPINLAPSIVAADGTFTNSTFAPDIHDLGVTFYLTATESTDGNGNPISPVLTAQTSFTDGAANNGDGTMVVSPTTAVAGSTGNLFSFTFTTDNGKDFASGSQVSLLIPAGWTSPQNSTPGSPGYVSITSSINCGSPSIVSVSSGTILINQACDGSGSPKGTFTLTYGGGGTAVTAPSAAIYTFTTKSKAGSGGTLANIASQPTVTVTAAPNTAPLVNRDNGTVTVSERATATNTGTWSDANTLDTVVLSASVGSVVKNGTNAAGTWSWSFGTTDGPAQSQTVTITANDGNGGITSTTFSLTVNNVAPTATLGNNGPVNEGSPATVSFTGQFDPSTADTSAGFHYAFSCTNGDLSGSTYAGSGASATTNCTFNDNGTNTVKARIIDKDGGATEYTTVVTVNNVPPTAALGNNGPINEGGSATISFSAQSDPSSVDTAAGFHYAYSCTNGDLSGATYAGSGTTASTSCPFSDSGSKTVKGRIIDKDGGFNEYTTVVTVNNVAPTATFAGPTAANEGDTKTYTFSGATDVSSDDVAAGFHYAYSCDGSPIATSTYAAAGTAATANCTFADNGSITVRGRIFDKDDGYTDYSVVVTVANIAPTATLGNNGPVNEGSPATVSFTGQFDPSTADTSAGFHYAFSCTNGDLSGSTYAGSGASATTNCTFNDNGTNTVKARIIDKDGGATEYTTVVTVNNVPPTATLGNNGPINEGGSATISFSAQSDPSSVDTTAGFHYAYSCTNGDLSGATYAGSGTTASTSCPFSDSGSKTVKGRIIDKDGGFNEYTTVVTVNNVAPTATFAGPLTATEGDTKTYTFTGATDVSSDDVAAGFHYAYSCNGSPIAIMTWTAAGTTATVNCTFPDNGSITVRGRIFDKDNGYTDYTVAVTVSNAPPANLVISVTPGAINEGQSATLSGGFTDPGALDTHSVSISWGDGTTSTLPLAANVLTFSLAHTYVDDNPTGTASDVYNISVSVADKDLASAGPATTPVTVNNVAPVISGTTITVPTNPMPKPASVTINVDVPFTDVGSGDTHTCTVVWDDGSEDAPFAATETAGSGTCAKLNIPHTFNAAGVYTVSVKVKDDDTGQAIYTALTPIVVYDASAGFVTGGGYIVPPAGAYTPGTVPDLPPVPTTVTTANNKSHFGFVSQYKKGANVPTGDTEFFYQAGDFKFNSTVYEWLVVSGKKAQFKGTGRINGKTRDFGFLLTAVDGNLSNTPEPDSFRMKIWDKLTGAVVYDSGVGGPDDIDGSPTTPLANGSIVIHTNNGK